MDAREVNAHEHSFLATRLVFSNQTLGLEDGIQNLRSARSSRLYPFRRRGATLVALGIGAAPGFLLPIALVVTLPLNDAASLLLVITITQIVTGALGAPYETTLLVRLGSLYGSEDSAIRPRLWRLSLHGALRLSVPMLAAIFGFLLVAIQLSPDLDAETIALVSIPLALSPIVRLVASPLMAHLYARNKLPSAYVSTVFLGGPSLVVALILPDPLAVATGYTLGELLRWAFLAWMVSKSQRAHASDAITTISPPNWRELSPQVTASLVGQGMPLLVQGTLTTLGAPAIASGAIALRIWGAAFQLGTSAIAMPETIHLVRTLPHIAPHERARWVRRRALVLMALSSVLLLAGGGLLLTTLLWFPSLIPPPTYEGLLWSLILLLGLPPAMLHFWAGRGLIAVGASRWVPISALIGLLIGTVVILTTLASMGGVGTMIGHSMSFAFMALTSFVALALIARRKRP